ncbi:tRNA (adenosine(37)-N6)-threonylcarbamoyltransferase complex dimerization subunit type 1 TsaB [Litoribrevibacter euphylliae]|uniref:tRNA threonylcarbamoyladenosine biosynthesis protein TsaB n=1 Tax=Litoribrevibacter euphylliae TaxID=1834034 RepID=A0ABV7H985_9GAMM
MKSTLLAIDTSTDACSVALLHNGEIFSDHQLLPREHTQNILPMVEAILSNNSVAMVDVDGLVVGAGPGSFTGLRIAFGVVQGFAFAVEKPVAAISTLTALAARAKLLLSTEQLQKDGDVIATVDARMNETYWARYRCSEGSLQMLESPKVSGPASIDLSDAKAVIGTGLVYQDQMLGITEETALFSEERPRAEDMLRYIQAYPEQVSWQSADQVEPLYVRNDVAKKKAEQQK